MGTEYTVSGWDVMAYYWRYFRTIAEQFSWQVRTSYTIILLSILCLVALFLLFWVRVMKRERQRKAYRKVEERFAEPFRRVLHEPTSLSYQQVEEMCECTAEDFREYPTRQLLKLIIAIRQELQEVIFLPNIQILCSVSGVRDHIEFNLQHRQHEFHSLQAVSIMQLPISEGLLANYVNHRDPALQGLARITYMIATDVEPYRFLQVFTRDTAVDDEWALWYPMALHQLFGWLAAKERPMPSFITLVEMAESKSVAAFFVEEISYWGSLEECAYLHNYFTSENYEVRLAAFRAVAMLSDRNQEQQMIDTFVLQPENLRREILRAVYAIRSGRQTQFFEEVYHSSSSKETREEALTCLYDYSTEGRIRFEELRFEDNSANRRLFDQIDSMKVLSTIRQI